MNWIILVFSLGILDTAGRSTSEGQSDTFAGSSGAGIEASELFMSARRGDVKGWNGLLERYLPLIRAIARGYRLSSADLEDVSQTVCLRLLEHIHRIRKPDALPAWIATTTRRESLRLVRHYSRIIPAEYLDEAPSSSSCDSRPDADSSLLHLELSRVLREGLNQLPANQRKLLILLSDEHSRSYREIGEMLAMPIGSIGPTRSRALATLKGSATIHDYFAEADGARRQQPA